MISTPQQLEEVVAKAMNSEAVGIDTEFVWERTYYPCLGIIQIGFSDDDCVLIDALEIKDLTPLGELLSSRDTTKILHDARQDLWILKRHTNTLPRGIFDTRSAAGFVGFGSTRSLGNLLLDSIGIDLPKTETRTDWLRRPLSEMQCTYALDDVRYLPSVRQTLLDKARENNHEHWLQEEMSSFDDPDLYVEKDPKEQFLRVKGISKVSARDLAIVRELAAWREEEARRQDKPKNRIFQDDTLVQLARRKPKTASSLKGFRGLNGGTNKGNVQNILNVIQRGLELPQSDCPQPPRFRPDPPPIDAQLDMAMAFLKGRCLSSGIDIALIASRSAVKAMVAQGPGASAENHPILRGWRYEFLGKDLVQLLEGNLAIRLDPTTDLPQLACENSNPVQTGEIG